MLKVQIAPHQEENFPGNLTQIFETDSLIGWMHLEGPPEVVTPELLGELVGKIKNNPQAMLAPPPNTSLSLALVTGSNDLAKFELRGNAGIKIQRGEKVITLSQNATGSLLQTDRLSFILEPKDTAILIKKTPASLAAPALKLHSPKEIFLGGYKSLHFPLTGGMTSYRRRGLYLALVVFLFLFASVLYQLRSRAYEARIETIKNLELEVERQIVDARTLADLNSILARSQLDKTKENTQNAGQKLFGPNWRKEKNAETKRVALLLERLEAETNSLYRRYSLSEIPLFYDTGLIKAGFNITLSSLHENTTMLLDAQTGTVISLDTKSKAAVIVTGEEKFRNARFFDFQTDRLYVFTQEGSIITGKNELVKKGEQWGGVNKMLVYGGNIYLLDPAKNTIWKYPATATGYSEGRGYLASGISPNLSRAADLAIDSDVYLLDSSGTIMKYSAGLPQDFSLKGLDKPLNQPVSIFTDENSQNLYVLDKGNSRVVVFDKKGMYVAQYLFPSTYNLAPRILADEANKKIFLFEASKIYGIEIR